MIVGNYTYKQFLELSEEERDTFATAIKYAKNIERCDYLGKCDVEDWRFVDVKECMQYIERNDPNGMVKYITEHIKGYSVKSMLNTQAYRVLVSFEYITDRIGKLIETEQMTLVSAVSNETRQALSQVDFSVFGYYPQLLELANNDVLKIEEVSNLPYSDAYVFLYYNTKKSELEKAITNIYKHKR